MFCDPICFHVVFRMCPYHKQLLLRLLRDDSVRMAKLTFCASPKLFSSEEFKYLVFHRILNMRKEVKGDGNSHKIRLDAEDMKVYGLREGDIIDIEICKIKEAPNRR